MKGGETAAQRRETERRNTQSRRRHRGFVRGRWRSVSATTERKESRGICCARRSRRRKKVDISEEEANLSKKKKEKEKTREKVRKSIKIEENRRRG